MDTHDAAYDNLPRTGLCLGLIGLIGGLIVAAMTIGRAIGFGAAPTLGSEAVHIQARVQIFAGCLPLMTALIWALAVPHDEVIMIRLRPLVTATILVGFFSGALVLTLNWAIVMELAPDHLALTAALSDTVAATLYLVLLIAMPLGSSVAVASHLILRSGAIWLLGYSLISLATTSGRGFLDSPHFMWFFETPAIEMVILGYVIPSSVALIMGAMTSLGDPRAIMRNLPTQLQIWHSATFLWFVLRVWCLRYPGSYQKLVLALAGMTIVVVIGAIAGDTSIFQRVFIPTRWPTRDREGLNLGALSLSLALLSCLLLAATSLVAAAMNSIPPLEMFSALLATALTGVTITAVGSVLFSIYSDYPDTPAPPLGLFMHAVLVVALGTFIAGSLWPLTMVVERSLTPTILGALVLTIAGAVVALVWIGGIWDPWEGQFDEDKEA